MFHDISKSKAENAVYLLPWVRRGHAPPAHVVAQLLEHCTRCNMLGPRIVMENGWCLEGSMLCTFIQSENESGARVIRCTKCHLGINGFTEMDTNSRGFVVQGRHFPEGFGEGKPFIPTTDVWCLEDPCTAARGG